MSIESSVSVCSCGQTLTLWTTRPAASTTRPILNRMPNPSWPPDPSHAAVSRADAEQAGLHGSEIRYLVRRGAWTNTRYGLYRTRELEGEVEGDPDEADRRALSHRVAAAQIRMGYRCVASHSTAALLHGLPVLRRGDDIFVTTPKDTVSPRRYDDIVVREATLPERQVTQRYDVRLTTVERTVVDLARARWPEEGLIVADAAMRAGLVDEPALRQVFATAMGWPGVRRARRVLAFADPRSESPLESVARWTFARAGLPPPVPQLTIRDSDGWTARVDFGWEEDRVVGEADGLSKYTKTEVLRAEKIRQERLEQLGYTVVRFTWNEIVHQTDRTIARLRRALRPASPGK